VCNHPKGGRHSHFEIPYINYASSLQSQSFKWKLQEGKGLPGKEKSESENKGQGGMLASPEAGNTKGGSITVPLTSCLTGLESAAWQLTIFVFICKTD
jgi:hypothetical protein